MNTYLQIAAFLYLSLILLEYFRKKKINSLENMIFTCLIITIIVTLIADIYSTIFVLYYPVTILTEYLIKFLLCGITTWVYLLSYYVYCISSEKVAEPIDFKNHPHKKHFMKAFIVTIIAIVIIIIWINLVPLVISVNGDSRSYGGDAVIITYIASIIGISSWIFRLIKNRKKLKNKKYIPMYIFFTMALVTIILQITFPQISIVTSVAAFITAIMFFSIENPDATLIQKLNEARKKAEEANNAKTEFLSSMSHEIRTPLNAIVGFGQALAKENISGKAKEEIQDILMASDTLLEIVNSILDISKIEANKIEIIESEYSTKKLINEIKSIIKARIGSKPVDLKVITDENLPAVLYGDSIRLKQVIINLLTNSVKYTEKGRILFQIKAENDLKSDISRLTISVQDTGIGMTEEDLQQLFNKFQRFDKTKNINIEGSGLGMTITKVLVDLMDGEINVKSKYGRGTTITINLNQKIIHKDLEIALQHQIKPFNASGSKILIVDDNKINLKVAERLLKDYNVVVETVNTGDASIDRILDGEIYDLIFMDIRMPRRNGIETLEALKNIVGFNIPVVALTADVISGKEKKYRELGFDDCLAKPIVEEKLYYLLRKYLKESPEKTNKVILEDIDSNRIHSLEFLEQNRINVKAGLELLKDIKMYEITLVEFYNELQNKINNLRTYAAENNVEDYVILAHALKTEARYIGCNELGDLAYELELAGKENNYELIRQKNKELITEANRIYAVIEKYLGE